MGPPPHPAQLVQQARQLSYVQQAIHSLIDEADLLLGVNLVLCVTVRLTTL